MKKQFKLYFLTIISLCFTLIVSAQNEISGTINGSDGIPLSAANVVIKGTAVGTAADFDGNFTLSSETPFPWTLVITSAGYSANEILVDSNQDDINIILQVSISELDEVVISASRKAEKVTESPSSISVLTSSRAELLAVPGGDPVNLLKNIQGVNIVQNGLNKSNITLRGRSVRNTTRTLILKDYRVLVDFFNNIYDNERVPLLPIDIQRTEIIRGPSGALWGPGVSAGVIHYITKDPFQYPGLSVETSYGNSFGDEDSGQDAHVSKFDMRYAGHDKNNKWGWKALVSYREGDDFTFDVNDTRENPFGAGTASIADYISGEFSGAGGAPTRDGQWTDFSGNNNTLDMDGVGIGTARGDGGGPFNLIKNFYSLNVEGTLEYRPSENFNLAIVPSYGESKGNFGNAGVFFYPYAAQFNTQVRTNIGKLFASANYRSTPGFDGDLNNPGWEAQYNNTGWRDPGSSKYFDFQAQYPITLGDKSDIVAGIDYKTMKRSYEDTFLDGSSNNVKQLGIFEDERYSIFGGYFQLNHKFSDKLKGVGAIRVDNFNVYGTVMSPKVGFVYNPKENTAWRIGYNQANTAPNVVRSFFQIAIGRRSNNIARNLQRHFYGAGQDVTFNSPLTGLMIPGNNLAFHFNGTDVPLQNVVDFLNTRGFTLPNVSGTSTGQLFSLENLVSNTSINNPQQLNAPKAGFETSETFEIGFKGPLGDKLILGADLYFSTEKNVPTAAVALSPGVQYNSVGSDLEAALLSAGVDATTAADAAAQAQTAFGNQVGAAVVSDQHQGLGTINGLTYGFRGYGEIKYWGIDAQADYYVDDNLSLFANWSFINKNEFDSNDINEDPALNRSYFLNSPKNRIRLGMNWGTDRSKKLFGNVSFQSNGSFNANFGDFLGEMPRFNTIDFSLGYRFTQDVRFSISGTNLFNEEVRGLPYLPVQGSFFVGTLRMNL